MGRYKVLSVLEQDKWNGYLSDLARKGLDDIYFYPAYIGLYIKNNSCAEAYIYQEDDNCFFFPYIKQEIDRELCDTVAYDFETAYGYGGPLSTTDNTQFLDKAWKMFLEYCRDSGIIAGFVRFHPLIHNDRLIRASYPEQIVFSNQIVFLTLDKSPEDVWNNAYASNKRKKVCKAKKKGVKVTSSNSLDDLKAFQRLYIETMKQLSAREFYYFDDRYFENIFDNLRDNFKVFLAKINDVDIGGALILLSQNFVHYHLSGNIKKYRAFEPASLLRHEVIMANLQSGRKNIFFGGGHSRDVNDSLFKFKAGFSKERADFYIGKLIFDKEIYQKICRNWEKRYPEKSKIYSNYLLKYRF